MANYKDIKEPCPDCGRETSRRGMHLHRLKHVREAERKAKEQQITKDPGPEPDPIEEIMNEEIPEPEIKEEVKEPVKEVVKPVAPVVPAGEVKPVKGKSFLDWLFGEDDEDKSSVSKSNKDEDDDWL